MVTKIKLLPLKLMEHVAKPVNNNFIQMSQFVLHYRYRPFLAHFLPFEKIKVDLWDHLLCLCVSVCVSPIGFRTAMPIFMKRGMYKDIKANLNGVINKYLQSVIPTLRTLKFLMKKACALVMKLRYVYLDIWSHLNDILHASLRSAIPALYPLKLFR